MAMTAEQKSMLELTLDYVCTFIVGYLVWTRLFNQPIVGGLDSIIAILGTAALGYWAFKHFRSKQVLR